MPSLFRVALFRLNAIGYCVFRKNAAALIFVRIILRALFFRVSLYPLNSICRFYYICGQFVLHSSALLHLWSIFNSFVGFVTFVAIIAFVTSTWPYKNAVVILRSRWSTVAFDYATNLIKCNHRSLIGEGDTHFQDHNNLLLHTDALQAPSSNQLLLGLAWVLFLLRPKTNKK